MRHRQYKEGSLCLSPSKTRHQLALVVQVLLHLLPHVKDGTVPTEGGEKREYSMSGVSSGGQVMKCCAAFPSPSAEHVLVEGTLTALALSPQAREPLLQCVQVIDL